MPAKKKRVPTTPAPAAKKKPPSKPAPAPTESTSAQKLSALDAAALVLRESGQPMSCPELIARMAAQGYWASPRGKTPASTLYAALAREAKRKGKDSRFQQIGPGRFAYRGDAERS